MGHFTVPFFVFFLVTLFLGRGKIAVNARGGNKAGSILFCRRTDVESPRNRSCAAASRHAVAIPQRTYESRMSVALAFSNKTRGDADGNGGVTEDE
jgi:hypothetical protein